MAAKEGERSQVDFPPLGQDNGEKGHAMSAEGTLLNKGPHATASLDVNKQNLLEQLLRESRL